MFLKIFSSPDGPADAVPIHQSHDEVHLMLRLYIFEELGPEEERHVGRYHMYLAKNDQSDAQVHETIARIYEHDEYSHRVLGTIELDSWCPVSEAPEVDAVLRLIAQLDELGSAVGTRFLEALINKVINEFAEMIQNS